jgi:peptidyl-prolyl cis-trans isomerase C
MNQVVSFHHKQPKGIVVNGEAITEETITAALEKYAQTPDPREAAARMLAVWTLLRQRAAILQIEAEDEEQAIEKLIALEVKAPPVTDEEVRRYFDGHRQKFRSGDLFEARHILFAGAASDKQARVDATRRAEATLSYLKSHPDEFEQVAQRDSECTSAKLGGSLGQLSLGAVVPEFWSALVGFGKTGLIPQPVETRFGSHIVLVERCAIGQELPFEAVEKRVRDYLVNRLEQISYRQYVSGLLESSKISGVEFGNSDAQGGGPGLSMGFQKDGSRVE